MRSLTIAATGMDAQQRRVEVISNNLSNMSTTGYKARRAEFADLLYQQPRTAGSINAADGTVLPGGVQLGLGVKLVSVTFDMTQGSLSNTGGELDLAINGGGWFEIQLPNGDSAYTRDGNFNRNQDGQVVTAEGYVLAPEIVIPDDAVRVSINPDGEVYALFQNQVEQQLLGVITLAEFANDQGLRPIGGNLHLETEASGPPNVGDANTDGRGVIRQGFVEESTVDAVREITQLIEAQRGYELNSKVVSAADQMMAATTQVR